MSKLTMDTLLEAKRKLDEANIPFPPKEIWITYPLYEKLRELEPDFPEVDPDHLPTKVGGLMIFNGLAEIGDFGVEVDPKMFRSRLREWLRQ